MDFICQNKYTNVQDNFNHITYAYPKSVNIVFSFRASTNAASTLPSSKVILFPPKLQATSDKLFVDKDNHNKKHTK